MRKKQPASSTSTVRNNRTTPIDQLLQGSLGTAAKRRGFADGRILNDWAGIVGPVIARACQPLKLLHGRNRPGTLHLHASGAAAVEIQHLAPQLIERINGYFGFQAVARLQIIQAPTRWRRTLQSPRPEPQIDQAAADRETKGIDDQKLRHALRRLHVSLQTARSDPKS